MSRVQLIFFPWVVTEKYNVSNNDDVLMCLLSTKYGIEMVQLTLEERVFVVKTYFRQRSTPR